VCSERWFRCSKIEGWLRSRFALIMSSVGLSTWVARPLAGYALDRFFAPFVSAVTFASAVAGLLLVVLTHSMAGTLIAGVLIGFALGSEGDLVHLSGESLFRARGITAAFWSHLGDVGVGRGHRHLCRRHQLQAVHPPRDSRRAPAALTIIMQSDPSTQSERASVGGTA